MHGKLHHLHGLVAYHYSSLQFTGALVACSSPLLAAALLGLAAAGRLHEAEARAAGTLEQELHHAYLDRCVDRLPLSRLSYDLDRSL